MTVACPTTHKIVPILWNVSKGLAAYKHHKPVEWILRIVSCIYGIVHSIKMDLCRRALQQTACFILVSCLAYPSTLKMVATCTSETSVDFHWATWYYIWEDRKLFNISPAQNLLLAGMSKTSVFLPCLSAEFQPSSHTFTEKKSYVFFIKN
jgi:hypothetical protein